MLKLAGSASLGQRVGATLKYEEETQCIGV